MKAGYLGPGSVVGSAAFNLLFITAVCIASVGSNETRRVNQIKVYAITLVYSMIGYAWLIMILRVTSPNIIDVWEAFGTLLLFFGLIISAYYCDKHSKDSEYTPRLWMTNLRGESLSMNSSLESSANLVKCVSGTLTPQMSVAEPRGSEVESPVQDSAMISGWREQISTAFHTSPGPCLAGRYFCHAVMFVWKICFSLVPPPSLWGGYPTFIISLAVIGILITLVSDMASLFGCLTGLKDLVVAFSFLAVGTSLPELFTSRLAAIRFKHADHSLGNVIGSNCINVFVGLGLPWFIASIYWRVRGQQFDIDGKSLSFTIGIYTCTAVAYTLMMIMRRNLKVCGKAEFGGPTVCKYLSAAFLVALWVAYISLSSLNVSGLLPFY